MPEHVGEDHLHGAVDIAGNGDLETSHSPQTAALSNDHRFIERLPDDVLLGIFFLLYSIWHNTANEHRRRSEIAVCRRWRLLALGTPLLWKKVSYPDTIPGDRLLNMLSFERSQSVLLDLTINAHALRRGFGKTIPFLLIEQNSFRVGSLDVIGHDIEDFNHTFARWSQLNTPQLMDVRITGTNMYFSGGPKDADNQMLDIDPWRDISSLTTLTLIGFSPFQFPSATNLRRLHISSTKLTTKGLRDLMRQFPVLESLAIDKVHPWYNLMGAEGYTRDAIYLPTLRKLALGTGRKHDGKCICAIGCIAAPNLEVLELRLTPSALNDDHLSMILRPENTTHLRKIRLAVAQMSLDDIPFLSTLPSITELEIPQLERCSHDSAALLIALLELRNLYSITLDIHPPNYYPGEDVWAPKRAYIDKSFFGHTLAADSPTLGSFLRLRGIDADVKTLSPEVRQILGNNVRTIGLYEGDPWIIPGWDALQLFDFADKVDDGTESDIDYDYNGPWLGWEGDWD